MHQTPKARGWGKEEVATVQLRKVSPGCPQKEGCWSRTMQGSSWAGTGRTGGYPGTIAALVG